MSKVLDGFSVPGRQGDGIAGLARTQQHLSIFRQSQVKASGLVELPGRTKGSFTGEMPSGHVLFKGKAQGDRH